MAISVLAPYRPWLTLANILSRQETGSREEYNFCAFQLIPEQWKKNWFDIFPILFLVVILLMKYFLVDWRILLRLACQFMCTPFRMPSFRLSNSYILITLFFIRNFFSISAVSLTSRNYTPQYFIKIC